MLWIALYLPELPLQLAQRAQQTTAPSVVVDGPALRPLVRCANNSALERGVKKVHIINGKIPHGLLLEIFTDKGIGTEIVKR